MAVETNPSRTPEAENVYAVKKHVADLILRKTTDLGVKNADELNEVIEQVEKLLETDEVRRVRHLRNAVLGLAIIAGIICVIGIVFLKDANASVGVLAALIFGFLALLVPGLLFTVYRLGQLPKQPRPSDIKPADLAEALTESPRLTQQIPVSVTEHTTRQMDEALVQPPKSEASRE
jgi:hypothetical protein